jgi:hypothetical protein
MTMARQPYTGEERRHSDASSSRAGVRFDPTINLGHIITFIGFILSLVVTWSTLDKRVVVLEESRKAQELRDSSQDQRNSDQMGAIRESLVEIKQNVIALRDRQDRQDRPKP